MIQHTYTPDHVARLDLREVDAPQGDMPSLPDKDEARAWVLRVCEGQTQKQIAAELDVTQGSVSRMIDRAAAKIDKLIALGWIPREHLERSIRRAVGLAARN